ncbi:MAG: 2Fe-2S iron-sulfur cluster-binding protein [Rhodanobacteraceae bacterium]
MSHADTLITLAGALIVLAVLAHVSANAFGAWRRVAHQSQLRQRADTLLDLRIDSAYRERQVEEQKSLAWAGWRKFQVRWKRFENERRDICSFYLVPHDGKPIPGFEPGQFLTFRLDVPGQVKPVVRCYSLSDSPKPDYYRVSIRRQGAPPGKDAPPGISSNYFHDLVQEDAILDVKAPSGIFHLDPGGKEPVVLIGGGVGITPVLSMLNAIVDSGSGRETWFFLGVRDAQDHPMKEHLEAIAREHSNVHLQVCYSQPREGQDIEGRDFHVKGFAGVELMRKVLPSNNYRYYFCGPPPMMAALEKDLKEWGVPGEHIHFEKFGPGPKLPTAPVVATPDTPGIEVSFSKSGKKLSWSPAVGTLLELARANGIVIDSGCEQGNCGTCQTAIRSGEVKYSSEPAYEFEQGTCLVCVCHPTSPLELNA